MPEPITGPREGLPTPEEALATLGRTHERLAAATEQTPGVVQRAFLPGRESVAGIPLPPISMRGWLRLEKIKSPYLRPGSETETPVEDMLRAFYIIAGPEDEVIEKVMAGEPAFSLAVDAFAARLPLSAFPELAVKLGEHVAREMEPQADFIRPGEEGDGGPKRAASSATGQAAG